MSWAMLIVGAAFGLWGARALLRARGRRPGEWSWRDGGENADV